MWSWKKQRSLAFAFLIGFVGLLWGGVVWRLTHSAPHPLTVLYTFPSVGWKGVNDGGAHPSSLILGQDGTLYGTASNGGPYGQGVVFRLDPRSNRYTVLHSFHAFQDGVLPKNLLQARNGLLYGIVYGGPTGAGALFAMKPDGSAYRILHPFSVGDGTPSTELLEGPDGFLYGTTSLGYQSSAVYRIAPDGSRYQVLYRFTNKGYPSSETLLLENRSLYELIAYLHEPISRPYPSWALIKIDLDQGRIQVSHRPSWIANSLSPSPPTEGFYLWLSTSKETALYRLQPSRFAFQRLYALHSSHGNVVAPVGSPVMGSDGALYGGLRFVHYPRPVFIPINSPFANIDSSAIFRLNADGSHFKILYRFSQAPSHSPPSLVTKLQQFFHLHHALQGEPLFPEGASPDRLVLGGNNTLYGISAQGGLNNSGTIFRLQLPSL
ncbi:MAG TPA: choice-of-anchor tandem repeat GloVer-containing protein [Chthonomonas sp.]|uniref:choice-of-anchor tandem repeat GloVer-containing protein n=1 Tax=Chthonomonas sp. TaxID=2282153 RepID=UPI002B4AC39E|nr:choice-of-anchor tandem repeat GloVer-containing protein [Chthonomonas sp.]HLI47157.1 choice-of-anchor tandem repeat GloVer-containing protein [Chthonomonas sp.]